jgi:leucyl aminopeptidase
MATLACARNKLAANVATLVPLVENMPSGSATRPGDVYTALNGLTVEVRSK